MYEQIENYYNANKAYLLFLRSELTGKDEHKNFILEEKYQIGAILGNLSSLLLVTKEDIVSNEGNLVYSSKVFDDCLISTINIIGTIESNGVRVGDYLFPDKETLVATIRNKIAHGDYEIDFESKLVILNIKGNEVKIDINKLATFTVSAFQKTIKDYKGSSYVRNVLTFKVKDNARTKPINDIKEFRYIAKNFKNTIFEIKSNDGSEIDKDCRQLFEYFLKIFKENSEAAMASPIYKEMLKHFESKNCTLIIKSKMLREKEMINRLEEYASLYLFGKNFSYQDQIKLMGFEIARYFGDTHRFDNAFAYSKNLMMLEVISQIKSVDHERIGRKLFQSGYSDMVISSNELAAAIINMFASLYIYPFEKLYMPTKEYHEEKKDLDFSLIDTSLFQVEVININDNPLKEMQSRCDSCLKDAERLNEILQKCKKNLENVRECGNAKAISVIEKQVEVLEKELESIKETAKETSGTYARMQADYLTNSNFFRNEAIIRGIRDAIAHGNYEVITNPIPTIIFKDIYEGDIAFKANIPLSDFYLFVENNAEIVLDFIKSRTK